MAHNYEIGTTYGGMENLADLTTAVPAPKSSFRDYSQYIDLGNSTVRGSGFSVAIWRWSTLPTRAQRDQLKTFCSGASASVYIRTRKNDTTDAYEYYTATMVWPEVEDREWGWRRDFQIEFRDCVVYTT